jgi:hypothetical protein
VDQDFSSLPDPELFCTDPGPSIKKQKSKKPFDFYVVTSFDFLVLSMKIDVTVPSKSKKQKIFEKKANFLC